MIICITGLPGSGKSTVSKFLKEHFENNCVLVRHYTTDWMREKLYPELRHDDVKFDRDFTHDELARSYNGIFMLFDELLRVNKHLVIITDGTYRKRSQRDFLAKIAKRHGVQFYLILVLVKNKNIHIKRLNKRKQKRSGSGLEAFESAVKAYEYPSKEEKAISIFNDENLNTLRKTVDRLIIKIK